MSMSTVGESFEQKFHAFVLKKIASLGAVVEFDDDTELVENMIISSLSLINLLASIEEYVGRDILGDEFGIEDFTTVNKIIGSVGKIVKPNYVS
ncbi:hypothetical protein PaecuDRAFT_1588 [Paenibacillus curdlanolyticus YK9]|uniref:Carrier domain-containing protein n=1 Tax=Paenibacillus curdlanolyticus YK9 TaxID=717606 RepID=E0I7G4_9BACL|nr:hypothetical protein [Paenibacillus curdlanolyticus]EFM11980.1 hypothetical protein PaecuDRAFT_1588 [Paenibacillus curdlanolyticus YK9]